MTDLDCYPPFKFKCAPLIICVLFIAVGYANFGSSIEHRSVKYRVMSIAGKIRENRLKWFRLMSREVVTTR